MNDYRFTDITREPSEEQLAALMHEAAQEATERYEAAQTAYFAEIRRQIQLL